ncbi:MAG: DUF6152 family protein [Gammaproteobacteria bacterium]
MRILSRHLIALAALSQLGSLEVSAHHSTGLFDGTTLITVEGSVSRIAWRSPHVYVFVESEGSSGEPVEWRFEALPVPIMVNNGWTEDSLSVGELVAVEAYPARQVTGYAYMHRLIKEDGTILNPGQTGSPGATEGEVAN